MQIYSLTSTYLPTHDVRHEFKFIIVVIWDVVSPINFRRSANSRPNCWRTGKQHNCNETIEKTYVKSSMPSQFVRNDKKCKFIAKNAATAVGFFVCNSCTDLLSAVLQISTRTDNICIRMADDSRRGAVLGNCNYLVNVSDVCVL